MHVEDDADIHVFVETLLGDIATITSVTSAKEFRELLAGCIFDLFILDLVLKDGSGSGLIRELKTAYPDTPVIILSAHDVTGAIDEADASFIKGRFETTDFIETVKSLLR